MFTALHCESNKFFLLFWEDYKLDQDLELSSNSFKLALQCMPNLFASGIFGMLFEHFHNYFHLKNYTSRFPQLFQLCFHISQGHIPCQFAHILGAPPLLTMAKLSDGVHPIAIGETLYRFTSHTLCF
jgi:hypothetical protein